MALYTGCSVVIQVPHELADDLVDFFFFRILPFLAEIFVVVRESVHRTAQNAH